MGTSGPLEQSDSELMGIVPRAAQALFERLNPAPARPQSALRTPKRYSTQGLPTLSSLPHSGPSDKSWTLRATYVEIYNEQLRDLLIPESVPHSDRANVAIREDTKGRILLTGLTQMDINSVEDLLGALNFGSTIRQTDATAINARSSRSHAVFSLNLVQRKIDGASTPKVDKRLSTPVEAMHNADNVVTIDSKLHFVDLAGSERLKNTGATGDRAKEGISINAGLASLGKVISQLSSRHGNAHISYRDSRLTRLLQDSLGGNAITFMVACVNPASFHMNETLNTLHYAQRARAIQSKPEIQQTHEDGDKQAAIDRLRAEVSFLRDQIRHSHADNSDRSSRAPGDRPEKSSRREAELQMQLMDAQENYSALSQRHARLISEISKARDDNADTPMLKEALGDNAVERLNRSSSFAEAVEQVVLEYEKTIQSLESSLTKTRTTLSSAEETLSEKQTRVAYMETVQQQLQARVQKALDREQNNESYLRDLESRMEGSTTDEEKSVAVIGELRKELTRLREGGDSAEEYISTLEERLAEAEQDQEIMQREIDRLEHVVERQRSIDRLDNLLSDLDSVRQRGHPERAAAVAKQHAKTNGHRDSYDPFRPPSPSSGSTAAHTNEDEFADAHANQPDEDRTILEEGPEDDELPVTRPHKDVAVPLPLEVRSPAQTDFMADKLENLTQELFDLRSEHESVITDFDNLQQKYKTALETLAKLEYDKEIPKPPHAVNGVRPESFSPSAGLRAEEKATQNGGQPSSSRSLATELSSNGASSTGGAQDLHSRVRRGLASSEEGDDDRDSVEPSQVPLPEDEGDELDRLRRFHAEQESSVAELAKSYQILSDRHHDALEQVEDLKMEVQRASLRPASPGVSSGAKPWKRRSDDLMATMVSNDRAAKSFTSLRTLALDTFDGSPDIRQSFELNLNTVMAELHGYREKNASLDAELATVKKDMDSKQAIIAGLTRERSTLQTGAGVDFTVVGQLRDQLVESENQIRSLHEQYGIRESELQVQLDSLKAGFEEHQKSAGQHSSSSHEDHMPGDFPMTPALELSQSSAGARSSAERDREHIAHLQSELVAWETRHHSAMESMRTSEAKLLNTIADLEDSMGRVGKTTSPSRARDTGAASAAVSASLGEERTKHRTVIDALQKEVDDYKSAANDHVSKLGQLEQAYASILSKADEDTKSRDLTQQELKTHKDLVSNLENQLQVHKSAITIHQESLESLQASHAQETEGLKTSMDAAENESKDRLAALEQQHKSVADGLQSELTKSQTAHSELLAAAAAALGQPTDSTKLHTQIRSLVDEGKELHTRHMRATDDLKTVQEELQSALTNTVSLEGRIGELKLLHEEALINMRKVTDKERKSSRLVEELEEQLNSNFDSHRAATHRLSKMETETVQVRQDMERDLEEQKIKNSMLEVSSGPQSRSTYVLDEHLADTPPLQHQISQLRRHSLASDRNSVNFNRESLSPEAAAFALARSPSQNSAVRKSGTVTALPTPPPSIPLPPLPGTPLVPSPLSGSANGLERAVSPVQSGSPPPSRHTSKDGSGVGTSALLEEQEARIRTIEKHLYAEKQLTATLEEALVDLETSANRTKTEMETFRKRCSSLEDELVSLRKEKTNSRASLQAVEEEREMRVRAERARQALEQRMMELNSSNKKKKKNALNCF